MLVITDLKNFMEIINFALKYRREFNRLGWESNKKIEFGEVNVSD